LQYSSFAILPATISSSNSTCVRIHAYGGNESCRDRSDIHSTHLLVLVGWRRLMYISDVGAHALGFGSMSAGRNLNNLDSVHCLTCQRITPWLTEGEFNQKASTYSCSESLLVLYTWPQDPAKPMCSSWPWNISANLKQDKPSCLYRRNCQRLSRAIPSQRAMATSLTNE